MQHLVAATPVDTPLLTKFTSVRVGDSTTVTLPADCAREFPDCGGKSGSGTAALMIQVLWDLTTGRLLKVLLEPGRHSDAKSAAVEETPPTRSLSLWDLGSFCLKRFRRWTAAGAFWIARWPPGTVVLTPEGTPWDLWPRLPSIGRIATREPRPAAINCGRPERERGIGRSRSPSGRHQVDLRPPRSDRGASMIMFDLPAIQDALRRVRSRWLAALRLPGQQRARPARPRPRRRGDDDAAALLRDPRRRRAAQARPPHRVRRPRPPAGAEAGLPPLAGAGGRRGRARRRHAPGGDGIRAAQRQPLRRARRRRHGRAGAQLRRRGRLLGRPGPALRGDLGRRPVGDAPARPRRTRRRHTTWPGA